MSSVNQGEELFFDTTDQLLSEKSVVKENLLCSNLEYDIWSREPQSVNHRRKSFLSKMGFIEHSPLVESEAIGSEEVSESNTSESSMDEKLLSERRESNSEANCSDQDWLNSINVEVEHEMYQSLVSDPKCENDPSMGKKRKKVMHWWRQFTGTMKKNQSSEASNDTKTVKMSVLQNKKRFMECTGVYSGQEIKAHNGLIWAMKFSPDGKYLASGGEDGVVCIWRARLIDASFETDKYSFSSQDNLSPQKKKSIPIIVPEKIFKIEEELVQKLKGHSSDVLDLAWSTSNHLLSSSMDKTVRLWRVGSDECLGVFHHSNYVTCVQFNPMDERHFISGSIDGKVRIWGVHKKRVEDWANVGDIVTAVCYQPNGKGFIVGSVSGNCRFYELSGDEFLLNAELNVQGRKKSSGIKITGIQFLKEDSQRVMITSEDSKIRILDGLDVVCKYRGLAKSGSQMSASFTSSGRHIISVGEDSRIYLWNYDNLCIQTSKQVKSILSCEYFFSEGVSVVLPWSPPNYDHEEASSSVSDSERFSLTNWFSMEGLSRTTVTWPEEKLPSFYLPSAEIESEASSAQLSGPWGLVFVTANWDGTIRTFHNYGLPVRT